MPARSSQIPNYRLHKPSGQARVIIDHRHIYLGRYGSAESWEKYHRLIAERLSGSSGNAQPQGRHPATAPELSISEVILQYWRHAREYYVKNGEVTGETENIRFALRPLRKLYGSTPAAEFGPDALQLVRQSMIDFGLSRGVINSRISRIKRMFRWACKNRLIRPEVYHGLKSVDGLKRGRSKAREVGPVRPVAAMHVAAVLPHVTSQVRAMIQIQELTGMRPQDIRNLRTCDLDMSADVWVYTPSTHKTEHHGHIRRIAIGPKAQAILRPFLKPHEPEAYCFSPKEAVAASRAARRRESKGLVTHELLRRKASFKRKRAPGDQYTKSGYDVAIARACQKAGVPRWGPNRLRHNCGTKVRRQ